MKRAALLTAILVGLLAVLTLAGLGVTTRGVEEGESEYEAAIETESESDEEEHAPRASSSRPLLRVPREVETAGDESSGTATALLFGLSSLPVVLGLVCKSITRQTSCPASLKATITRFGAAQAKYLLPWHTYLGLAATALGAAHLLRSSCPNPLPEWGLAGAALLSATGLAIKFKVAPRTWMKWLYKFHVSPLATGVLCAILFAGHLALD